LVIDISRDRVTAASVRTLAGSHETTPTINIRRQIMATFEETVVEDTLKTIR